MFYFGICIFHFYSFLLILLNKINFVFFEFFFFFTFQLFLREFALYWNIFIMAALHSSSNIFNFFILVIVDFCFLFKLCIFWIWIWEVIFHCILDILYARSLRILFKYSFLEDSHPIYFLSCNSSDNLDFKSLAMLFCFSIASETST